MSEVGMAGAGCDDEIIVTNFAIGHSNLLRVHVDRLDVGEHDLRVFAFAQHRAHRRGDIGRGKRSGRDLVKERLKQMIIRSVDHRDSHIFAGELLCRLEPAESRAENDDVWLGVHSTIQRFKDLAIWLNH